MLFLVDGEYMENLPVAEAVAFNVVKEIKAGANLGIFDRQLAKIGYLVFNSHNVPEIPINVTTLPNDGLRESMILNIKRGSKT